MAFTRKSKKEEAAEQPVVTEEQEFAEEAKTNEVPEELVSEGTRRNASSDIAFEELRKAETLKAEADVARAKREAEENREVTSTASEEQYSKRLAELEAASVDMHLPYNERLRAREAADLMRGVLNDMKGEGDPAGPTLATEDRKEPKRLETFGQQTETV